MGGSSARLLFRQHSTRPKNVEYLYGASVVIPAMEFGVRKIKTLLVKEDQRFGGMKIRGNGEAILSSKILPKISSADMGQDSRALLDYAVALANQREIPVKEVPVSHLDRLAGNRPHQGLVLATLAPKVTHLHALGNCDLDANDVDFEKNVYEVDAGALDQIVDPQNLGAILRSAYYFGVDGVVVTERDSAPFSPISSKASAGAMEAMPLYSTVNLGKLLQESAINGWQILGTNTNAKKSDLIPLCHFKQRCDMEVSNDLDDLKTHTPLLRLDSAPTILVLGNEGHGMRTLVSKHCHHHLIITQDQFSPNFKKSRIDSLNVSVAAGILLHELLLSV
ncbi:hypothetical protein BDEG_20536 [Batrachochytrium dendrobatidis JEL423]|uniref:rRNA methyltransferase 1, mitochondrial n=1 Tax=Batrachochytrium dendrobatidis (strain JEL423) TaxID=403673 RepID=A0A177W9D4_BATDL|nr:hypothetical protein BDEG_20536 [Batrachochytrium dendrobatidis JEL423]